MENEAQQITHAWDRILFFAGIFFSTVSLADVKDWIQFYSLVVGALALTLSCILYAVKIRKERAGVKSLGNDLNEGLKKNCP